MEKQNRILSPKTMWIYAIGILGVQLPIGLVNSYQAEFFNKILGASLMVVAAIILVAKFISIIADFIIGNLIDRCHMKGGKLRPWLLISAFPLTVLTMLTFVFIPFSSDILRYLYILLITVLWNITMSLADIPSQGMLALLSPDGNERNTAAGIANTLKSAGLASPGVFATVICMLTGSGSVGKREYLLLACLMSAIGLVLYLLIYFFCRENVHSDEPSAMSFREMFSELRENKMLLIVFATFILGFGRNIGLSIAVQTSTILLREGIDLSAFGMGTFTGDGLSWLIGTACAVSSMISIVLVPAINRRWGEKKTFIVFAVYGLAISVIDFLLYSFGTAAMRSLPAILIYLFFQGFSFGPNGFLPMVMVSDIVDYREWKTGKRTEGSQFAVLSLSNKLSNALSVAIGIFLVGAIGFSSEMYYSTLSSGADITSYITNGMQTKLWAIYILLPGICMALSCIPMLKYKIDFKTKEKMRSELEVRRAKQAADR